MTWLIHARHVTHSYAWHYFSTRTIWHIRICDIIHTPNNTADQPPDIFPATYTSNTTLSHVGQHSFTRTTWQIVRVTWLTHLTTRQTNHSTYFPRLIRQSQLFHMWDITLSREPRDNLHVWHDSHTQQHGRPTTRHISHDLYVNHSSFTCETSLFHGNHVTICTCDMTHTPNNTADQPPDIFPPTHTSNTTLSHVGHHSCKGITWQFAHVTWLTHLTKE